MRRMLERPLRLVGAFQCIVLGGLLFLVPRIGSTFTEIKIAVKRELVGHRQSFWDRQLPRAGENVLPSLSLDIISIARTQGLKSLRLSPSFAKDDTTTQRVAEGGWPIRVRRTSRNLFLRKGEPIPSGCAVRQSSSEVVYVVCD